MKRSMKLVRGILQAVEDAAVNAPPNFSTLGADADVLNEHIRLCVAEGLLEPRTATASNSAQPHHDLRLTWKGHELIPVLKRQALAEQSPAATIAGKLTDRM